MLCLAWSPLSYSNTTELVPGQVYTTNNIVVNTQQGGPSTWTNGVYQNNLTCWRWGDPGYCGPNAIVRPDGNINFSFGQTDLYQSQAVANVLPALTGLRVNGYNFSFTAKNGNGWDNGRVDSLYAYTHFTNQNNQVVSYKTYNLNYNFNWTNFNFSETFTTPFVADQLKNVTYGFVGRDNNGWAGPYGPEINNVSFSLRYSVDPCASNPLYSPSCPGYIDAINKLKPATIAPAETTQAVAVKEPATEQTPVAVVAAPTSTTTAPSATTTASSSTAPTQTTTAATTQTSQRSSSSPSIGTILSIITGVQAQVSSVERSVVQQAVQEAIKAGERAVQQAETVSSAQNQQQQESQQTQQNLQSSSVQQTFSNSTRQEFSLLGGSVNQRNNTSLPSTVSSNQESFSQNLPQPTTIRNTAPQITTTTVTLPSLAEAPQPQQTSSTTTVIAPQQPITTQQQPQQSSSIYSLFAAPKPDPLPEVNIEQRQVIGPTNLLQQFLDQKPSIENVSQPQQTRSVNQAARDSELAGQVSLANIARQPQGFQTYLAVLQDVPFYKPTEVYANQRTVDNQRAMRLLSGASEARHRELVDSQYRR